MTEKLQGAYVQAWVWVDLADVVLLDDDNPMTDDEIREEAKAIWHKDGEIEIDEGATVSRSYEGG